MITEDLETEVPRGLNRYKISSKELVSSQVATYIDAMKAFMGRILHDLQAHQIDDTKRGILKQRLRDILMKRVDYSKSSQLVGVLRQLHLPDVYGESLSIFEASGGGRYGGGSYYRTVTAGAESTWFDKILQNLQISPEKFTKYAPKIAIGLILASAASFFIYQVMKKVRVGNDTWKIVQDDIHPVVFELMDLMIDGKVTNQAQINDILSQTEEAVIKKYSLDAVR